MMTIRLPKTDSRVIFLLLGYGLVMLLWLSLEDNGMLSVALIGTGSAMLFPTMWVLGRFGGQEISLKNWSFGMVLGGAMTGALATLAITMLMFFKTGWHGHEFADYPPLMMLAMLQRMPIWAIAGGLNGLAIILVKLAVSDKI